MNKFRRKEIYEIIFKLQEILNRLKQNDDFDYEDLIEEIIDEIQDILTEEEFSKDSVPENLQSGDAYQQSENACDNLEFALEELNYIFDDDVTAPIESDIKCAIDYLYKAT